MSHQASDYAKEITVCPNGEPITRPEKFLLMILADYHQAHGGTFPSIDTLSKDTLSDPRTTRRTLQALQQKGVINIIHPFRQGRGMFTGYEFCQLRSEPKQKGDKYDIEPDRRGTEGGVEGGVEGGQKGDKNLTLYKEEQEQEQEQEQKPNTLARRLRKKRDKLSSRTASRETFTEEQIERIYEAYPRKESKRAALSAILKALERIEVDPGEDPVDSLEAIVKEFAASPKGKAGQFCPMPSTWFNQAKYLDDPKAWERN